MKWRPLRSVLSRLPAWSVVLSVAATVGAVSAVLSVIAYRSFVVERNRRGEIEIEVDKTENEKLELMENQ